MANVRNNSADDFIAPRCDETIEILYQDEHILLINKPSKLLSLSGKNPANLDSVHYRLVQDFPTALMIHRLDLGTSGIMVIALSKDVSRNLNRQFSERKVKKSYTALLAGTLKPEQGQIDLAIAKGEFPYQKICPIEGKPALTEYQCLSHEDYLNQSVTRVQYTPLTGRTHQLRIHSQQIGHSILGCDLYPNIIHSSTDTSTAEMAERLMLHATTLEFTHPVSGEPIRAHCPCPF